MAISIRIVGNRAVSVVADAQFDNQATLAIKSLAANFNRRKTTAELVAVAMSDPDCRSREVFRRLVRTALAEIESLRKMSWVPYVRESERVVFEQHMSLEFGSGTNVSILGWGTNVTFAVEYYPVVYQQPGSTTNNASETYLQNMAPTNEDLALFNESARTGKILFRPDRSRADVLTFMHPVYCVNESTRNRYQNFQGFLMVEYDTQTFFMRPFKGLSQMFSRIAFTVRDNAERPVFAAQHDCDHCEVWQTTAFPLQLNMPTTANAPTALLNYMTVPFSTTLFRLNGFSASNVEMDVYDGLFYATIVIMLCVCCLVIWEGCRTRIFLQKKQQWVHELHEAKLSQSDANKVSTVFWLLGLLCSHV